MRRVLRIGHRGAAGHDPENTLAAIQKGIALGVDFVEIDLRRTADRVLVVLHDKTVNRTTNGKGRVDQLSLQEVKKFNAGNGEHIPTLKEVLKVAAGEAGLMLELKVKGMAQQTAEVLGSETLSSTLPSCTMSYNMFERSNQRPLSWCSSAVCPVPPSPVRLNTDLPTSVFGTTRPRVCSWIHSTVRACSCSSTRQTLPATSSVHSPLTSMGLYRTFLNASRVSSSYPPSLCLMLIDVLVEHNLGEYIAGLLTGYSPGTSLSPE